MATAATDAWLFPVSPAADLERWNGSVWSDAGTSLGFGPPAADASSSSDVWAAAYSSSAVHFDGVSWTAHPLAGKVNAFAVSVVSPTFAVEGGDSQTGGPQVERWNGSRWRMMPAPDAILVVSISALGKNDIWAVVDHLGVNMLAHWDGTSWTLSQPEPTTVTLRSVSARSPTDVWAVAGDSFLSDTFHFDGVSWSEVPIPATSPARVTLNDVSAEPGSPTIAVGGAGAPRNRKAYAMVYQPQAGTWKQQKLDPAPDGFRDFDTVSVVPGSGEAWTLERAFVEHRTCS